jgi:hypothetical protein
MRNRSNYFRLLLTLAASTGCLIALWSLLSIDPDGKYSLKAANSGRSYFEFSQGKLSYVQDGVGAQPVGSYYEENGAWFIVTDKGYTNSLEPGWFSVRITDIHSGHWVTLPRQIFGFKLPVAGATKDEWAFREQGKANRSGSQLSTNE